MRHKESLLPDYYTHHTNWLSTGAVYRANCFIDIFLWIYWAKIPQFFTVIWALSEVARIENTKFSAKTIVAKQFDKCGGLIIAKEIFHTSIWKCDRAAFLFHRKVERVWVKKTTDDDGGTYFLLLRSKRFHSFLKSESTIREWVCVCVWHGIDTFTNWHDTNKFFNHMNCSPPEFCSLLLWYILFYFVFRLFSCVIVVVLVGLLMFRWISRKPQWQITTQYYFSNDDDALITHTLAQRS